MIFTKNSDKKSDTAEPTDFYAYADLLEQELEQTLSRMAGVGKCRIVITFSDSGETVYACNESLSDGTSGKVSSQKSYVLVSSRSEGLILKVSTPSVLGVAVICEGGDSTKIKNDVTEVLGRTLGISSDRISVKKMQN